MVVGSPGIVANTSYYVINMAPLKSLIWGKFIIIVSIGDFVVGSMSVKKVILHKRQNRTVQNTQMIHLCTFLCILK